MHEIVERTEKGLHISYCILLLSTCIKRTYRVFRPTNHERLGTEKSDDTIDLRL